MFSILHTSTKKLDAAVNFAIVLFCMFFFHGIGLCQVSADETLDEIYTRANKAFDKGYYKKSTELFEKLNKQYPLSAYEPIILLKLADAHFELGHYLDTVFVCECFEQKYLHNENYPNVLYKKAKAYLNQTRGLYHDQTCSKVALDNYLKLINLFPESKYGYVANVDIDVCYENMSGHEFYVGLFYYKSKKYSSAISRFSRLISSYPDSGYHYLALLYLSECEQHLTQKELLKNS